METFTISVIVENVQLTDEVLDTLFTAIEDVVPSSIDGVVEVTAPVEAADDESAAFYLINALQAAVPRAVPVRLDQDLVSISDIAERTGRTRESVRLLIDGKRGPGGFPVPIGSVGSAIRVWPWAIVVDWFRTALSEDLGERGVSPETAALVDACLAGKRRRRFTHQARIAWTPTRVARTKIVATPYEAATTGQTSDGLVA